ncbi:MAG: hypothetical protein EZS28_048712, partial [Streblomastix strix]
MTQEFHKPKVKMMYLYYQKQIRHYYELLGEKAETTELPNYVTLCTSQTITANRTFNSASRFVSSIDGMATVTGSSFIKSGADNTAVLLGASGSKLISEFTTTIDDQNYVKKMVIGNLTATQFIKSGKDDTSVLLAGEGDVLLSLFGEFEDLTSTITERSTQ